MSHPYFPTILFRNPHNHILLCKKSLCRLDCTVSAVLIVSPSQAVVGVFFPVVFFLQHFYPKLLCLPCALRCLQIAGRRLLVCSEGLTLSHARALSAVGSAGELAPTVELGKVRGRSLSFLLDLSDPRGSGS